MFKHYLTTALRHFRQHKLTTSINVVCLTIGLVCFLAIYATITYLKSSDRHFPNSDRIYMITWQADGGGSPVAAFGPWIAANYLRTDFPEIEKIARATFDSGMDSEVPMSAGDRKSFVHVIYADADFLDVFALPFLSGDSRNALRAPRSAVIAADSAISLFGSIENAAGKTLLLQDGRELTVRGVVDALKQPSHISTSGNFAGMVRFDVLVSMDVLEAEATTNPTKQWLRRSWLSPFVYTYVLLPEDGSLSVTDLRTRLKDFGPKHTGNLEHVLQFGAWSLTDFGLNAMGAMVGTHKTGISATAMFYFLGVVVLAISCLNYANLATAQATTRAKEIGMRRIVGAHRAQIITQFMMEAALQSLSSLLIALLITVLFVLSEPLPAAGSIVLSVGATLTFWTMTIALLTAVTIAAGLYPAFVLSNVRPAQAVRAAKAKSGGRFVSQLLVGVQFSGAAFLLISMLVMVAQNIEFKRNALPTTSDPLVAVANNVGNARLDYEVLRAELLRQPHIQSVTASLISPWAFMAPPATVTTSLDADARTFQPTQVDVNYDFFATLRIKLLAGRDFDRRHANDSPAPNTNSSTTNVVIDRALAELNGWSNPSDALGKTLYAAAIGQSRSEATARTVIGVVENRPMTVVNFSSTPSNIYVLGPQSASSPIVRVTRDDPAAGLKEIETVWNRLAPSIALKSRFADDILNNTYWSIKGITAVFGGVAALALLISVLGLIGMSIHVISRRQHEIGVRKTLGASVRSIVELLLIDFSKPVVIANLLVWPLAFFAMQFYLSIFTQRTSLTFVPFVSGLVITVLIAWIAVIAQASRAARMNPATVLRYE